MLALAAAVQAWTSGYVCDLMRHHAGKFGFAVDRQD